MAGNAWPEDVKTQALNVYIEQGLSAASRATGVPSGTIKRWAWESDLGGERRRAEIASKVARAEATKEEAEAHEAEHRQWLTDTQIRQERKRAELRELLLDRAVEALHRMDDEHIDFKGKDALKVVYPKPSAAEMRNYAMTAAILLDKYRLENGEATDRREVTGDSPIDREVARLVDELARQSQASAES